MYKFIDLFCGIGGFHLAFENLAECVFANDWNEHAVKTYRENFTTNLVCGDLSQIDINTIPDHDILCAGFPCQPFSIAGTQEGFNHPTQGTLFFDVVSIIKEKKPKVVFLENVKNLIKHDQGNTFQIILKSIRELGYHIKFKVLNTTEYGNIPHNRERIFILCFSDVKQCEKFKFPQKLLLKTELFKDIIDITKPADKSLYQTNTKSSSVKKMNEYIHEKNHIYQYRRFTVRKNMSNVCPTLTANMGSGGHNVPLLLDDFGIRKLSVRECFDLQGFPSTYVLPKLADSHLYKQIGNSVSVPVIRRISENIIKSFS